MTTRQDLVDALIVERYTPFRRVETLSLSPADVQAGMARLSAATAEVCPDLVTCRGCGDLRAPDTSCTRCQARRDCPICDARRVGASLAAGNAIIDAPSAHRDRIYITTDRLYAKHYASLYGRGDLYRVEPIGDLLRSTEDSYETYAVTAARVASVYDRAVLLTWSERRRLYREWGQADLDHAAAQRVSGVSGGADERLSEYTGTTTKAAPAGASTPGVRGPDPYEGGALTQDSRVSSSVVLDG